MKKNYYETLEVAKTATDDEIKHAYRRLAHKFHPDKNPGDKAAEESFKKVSEAYEVLSTPEKRARYDKLGSADPITISSRKVSFQLDTLIAAGDIADIYKARNIKTGETVALKVVRNIANNDLMENEATILKTLWGIETDERGPLRFFPRLHDSLKVDDGSGRRVVNVQSLMSGWTSLETVRAQFPGGVQMEHGVWMLNRTLEGLAVLHQRGYVHAALTPAHLLPYGGGDIKTDPWNHMLRLVGFGAATPIGGVVRIISPKYKLGFYAPEILKKREITASADIYMAVKSIMYVLGGDPVSEVMPAHVPKYLTRFLKAITAAGPLGRPGDAWALHEELKAYMAKYYGPKTYVHFEMPTAA